MTSVGTRNHWAVNEVYTKQRDQFMRDIGLLFGVLIPTLYGNICRVRRALELPILMTLDDCAALLRP